MYEVNMKSYHLQACKGLNIQYDMYQDTMKKILISWLYYSVTIVCFIIVTVSVNYFYFFFIYLFNYTAG